MRYALAFIGLIAVLFGGAAEARASALAYVSDRISTSQPGASSNHTITFATVAAIPPSGKIIITPEDGFFTIPAGFDYTDVDLATATSLGGPFTDRTLADTPSAASDGVSVATGSAGVIVFTLNAASGIGAGAFVQIELGTHALFGGSGSRQIANPVPTRTYSVRIETQSDSGGALDSLNAKIAIVPSVTMGPVNTKDFDPPILTEGLPSGSSIPSGITQVELSLSTDEFAICKYAIATGTSYLSMTSTFSFTGQKFHTTTVGGISDGATYVYYVRCTDFRSNANPDDYPLSFTIGTPLPPPGPGPGKGPGPGGGGVPGSGGGGSVFGGVPGGSPYPPNPNAPRATLSGFAYPLSAITVLKDGKIEKEIAAEPDGTFSAEITNLSQGLYGFGLIAKDSDGRRSPAFSSMFSVVAGTQTLVSNILMPPTMEVRQSTSPGVDVLRIFGQSAPQSTVDVRIAPIASSGIRSEDIAIKETTAGTDGRWRVDLDGTSVALGAYEVRARAYLAQTGYSIFGEAIPIGTLGKASENPSDINGDGRVNFIDFSILLFNWGKENPESDINGDGKVGLADFSILLTRWTG